MPRPCHGDSSVCLFPICSPSSSGQYQKVFHRVFVGFEQTHIDCLGASSHFPLQTTHLSVKQKTEVPSECGMSTSVSNETTFPLKPDVFQIPDSQISTLFVLDLIGLIPRFPMMKYVFVFVYSNLGISTQKPELNAIGSLMFNWFRKCQILVCSITERQ